MASPRKSVRFKTSQDNNAPPAQPQPPVSASRYRSQRIDDGMEDARRDMDEIRKLGALIAAQSPKKKKSARRESGIPSPVKPPSSPRKSLGQGLMSDGDGDDAAAGVGEKVKAKPPPLNFNIAHTSLLESTQDEKCSSSKQTLLFGSNEGVTTVNSRRRRSNTPSAINFFSPQKFKIEKTSTEQYTGETALGRGGAMLRMSQGSRHVTPKSQTMTYKDSPKSTPLLFTPLRSKFLAAEPETPKITFTPPSPASKKGMMNGKTGKKVEHVTLTTEVGSTVQSHDTGFAKQEADIREAERHGSSVQRAENEDVWKKWDRRWPLSQSRRNMHARNEGTSEEVSDLPIRKEVIPKPHADETKLCPGLGALTPDMANKINHALQRGDLLASTNSPSVGRQSLRATVSSSSMRKNIGTPRKMRKAIENDMQNVRMSLDRSLGSVTFRNSVTKPLTKDFGEQPTAEEDTSSLRDVTIRRPALHKTVSTPHGLKPTSTPPRRSIAPESSARMKSSLRSIPQAPRPSIFDFTPETSSSPSSHKSTTKSVAPKPRRSVRNTPAPASAPVIRDFAYGNQAPLSRSSTLRRKPPIPTSVSSVPEETPIMVPAEEISAFITSLREKYRCIAATPPKPRPSTTPPGSPPPPSASHLSPYPSASHTLPLTPHISIRSSVKSRNRSRNRLVKLLTLAPKTPLRKSAKSITPSKAIEASLDRAIDEQIRRDEEEGRVWTSGGQRVKELVERREGRT